MLRNTLLFIQLGLFLPTLPLFQGLAGDTRARFRRGYTANLTAQPLGLYSWGEGWGRPLRSAWPAARVPARGRPLQPLPPGPIGSCPVAVPTEPLAPGSASTFSDSPVGEFFF